MGGGYKRHTEEEEEDEKHDDDDEEEEEALSLCDLPLVVTKEDQKKQNGKAQTPPLEADHDFEFGSWAGSILTESENMCAAEDVFFQGQILPLHLSSVSSHENLSTGAHHQDQTTHNNPIISRCTSRSSDSLEHCSSSGFTSSNSRSSSSRSHNSSSSATTTATCSTTYKPKVRNLFHSHPSPRPQVWFSGSRPKNPSARNRRSTIWGLFRPGLVQTPEIELQHYPNYKLNRNKNKSFSSSSSTSAKSNSCSSVVNYGKKERKRGEVRNVFDGCKCSVDAIGTVSSSVVMLKNSKIMMMKKKKKKKKKVNNGREIIMKEEEKEKENEKEKEKKQRKEAMYYRRTFEWLKELSIGDDELDEAYASRS